MGGSWSSHRVKKSRIFHLFSGYLQHYNTNVKMLFLVEIISINSWLLDFLTGITDHPQITRLSRNEVATAILWVWLKVRPRTPVILVRFRACKLTQVRGCPVRPQEVCQPTSFCMPPGRPLRVFQPTKRNMSKYSVRTGKHAGTSYLSLGKFVYHKYNYVVTGSHINDISRHFTPKLIRYLRTFVPDYL